MYMEHLECYFAVNDVVESRKQRTILLSCCGAATYGLIRSLASPSKPTTISYAELVKRATAHFHPRPLKIVSWFKFNSRAQHPGEFVAASVAELHKMFEFCEYGESLDDTLCDQLVCVR